MAHIERRKLKTGVSYRVRYIDPDGREKSRSFKRKADADDFLTDVAHAVRAGSYIDPAAGRQTLRAYLEEWRAMQSHHRAKTASSTKTRFNTMVYPHIGNIPLGKLRPSTFAKWQATLVASGKYASTTIRTCRGQVAGALNDAVRDRRLATNPMDGLKAPEPNNEKIIPRTIAQVEAARAITPERYRAVIRTDAGSGLRWGELFGLTRDRIDFLRREIRVDRQLAGRKGPEPVFGPPKTKASDRTVPIGDIVIAELAAHLAKYPTEPHQLVFRTSRGTPLTRGTWQSAWSDARDAMGLEPGEGLHHLRHFYASILIADGRSVIEVQERLGHASAQETLDTYAHLFPDSDEGTRKAIDRAFAALEQGAASAAETGSE